MNGLKKAASLIIILLVGAVLLITFLKTKLKKEEKMEKVPVSVRQPAVAGMFYPGEKSVLEEKIKSFLDKVRPHPKEEGFLQILIVPHAGYEYSGSVAAAGFGQLKDEDYSTVILLGGSHRAYFQGAAIDENEAWETPLGQVLVDKDLAKKIVEEAKGVSFSSSTHLQEHSLEVELPFLQSVIGDFKIVPILLGETDENLLKNLAEALNKNLTNNTLVVVSTDLSHYPPYETANKVDRATVDSILSGEPKNFGATISAQMRKGYPNLDTCACGEKAVKVGMILAKKLGKGKWKLLKYANSGDMALGDKSRVVGYASIGYYAKMSNVKAQMSNLDKEQQEKLLEIARKTLESYLANKKIPEFEVDDEQLEQKLGAFVTLRKHRQLRGCIGQIEPSNDPLWQVVRRMVVEAAAKDIRFPPVKANELNEIEIEISVLSTPQKIEDPYKIELGTHGVIIKKGIRSGVFLPQVATESNWDLDAFMGELCSQKAGLPWDCWKKGEVDIFVFTAQVFEEEQKSRPKVR